METSDIYVERLKRYTQEDAAGIGRLMPYLSETFTDDPIAEDLLTEIIESLHHDQLVARRNGEIIGTATLSLIIGAGAGKKGWLEDFVTDQEAGVKGIGQYVWDEMGIWCQEHGVDLNFTSNSSRTAAHDFYSRNQAETRDTTVFIKKF